MSNRYVLHYTFYVILTMSAIALRWTTVPDILPKTWTPESRVRYTAWILEEPDLTDSKTIIRQGKWQIELKGYKDIMPGRKYSFFGKVEPKVLLSKTVKIVMVDPTFEELSEEESGGMGVGSRAILLIGKWRGLMVDRLQKWLPEPHASLAAGILLGVKRNMPWEFYQSLVNTGTLHIIAASGYNVNIVASVVMSVILGVVGRGWAIVWGIIAILVYVILAGGGAAVVRAAIMGGLSLIAYYWGRVTEAKRLLWITVMIMLLADPLMLLDVGFELSVSATVGLLYLEPLLEKRVKTWFRPYSKMDDNTNHPNVIQGYLAEYLYPTLAASVATMPVTLLWFSRMSWLSPITNMLVLPLTPLIMFLSAIVVLGGMLSSTLGWLLSLILYVPLEIFVGIIELFG